MTAEARPTERLEQLYRAEHPGAVRLALLLSGDPSAAEELAQEAFLRVAPRLVNVANPGGYLRTAVVNLCRDHGRRQLTALRYPPGPPQSVPAPDVPSELGEAWQAITLLPAHQREALVLRFWIDLSVAEIGRLLGVPQATVRSRIRRGLASLKEVLHDVR